MKKFIQITLLTVCMTALPGNASVKVADFAEKCTAVKQNGLKKDTTWFENHDECLDVCRKIAATNAREANVCVQYCQDQNTDRRRNGDRKWTDLGNAATLLWFGLKAL